jgi:hypothetical protein
METLHSTSVPLQVDNWTGYAILLRTHLIGGAQGLHSIVVQSPFIKARLRHVFADYPSISLDKLSAWTIEAPFKPFVHHSQKFVSAPDDCQSHVKMLCHG